MAEIAQRSKYHDLYRYTLTLKYIKRKIDAVAFELRERVASKASDIMEFPIEHKLNPEMPVNSVQRISKTLFLNATPKKSNADEAIYALLSVREKHMLRAPIETVAQKLAEAMPKIDTQRFYTYVPLNKKELFKRLKQNLTPEDRKALRGHMSDFQAVSDYISQHRKRLRSEWAALDSYTTKSYAYLRSEPIEKTPFYAKRKEEFEYIAQNASNPEAAYDEMVAYYIDSRTDTPQQFFETIRERERERLEGRIGDVEFLAAAKKMLKEIGSVIDEEQQLLQDQAISGAVDPEPYYSVVRAQKLEPKKGIKLNESNAQRIIDEDAVTAAAEKASEVLDEAYRVQTEYSVAIEEPNEDFRLVQEQVSRVKRYYGVTESDESHDEGYDIGAPGASP